MRDDLITIGGGLAGAALAYALAQQGADVRRARVLPQLAQNLGNIPDLVGLGPEAPNDELARQRLFATSK